MIGRSSLQVFVAIVREHPPDATTQENAGFQGLQLESLTDPTPLDLLMRWLDCVKFDLFPFSHRIPPMSLFVTALAPDENQNLSVH